MKIILDRLSIETSVLEEDISSRDLGLDDVPELKVPRPLHALAEVTRISNAVHVELRLTGTVSLTCTRCVEEFSKPVDKQLRLDYAVEPRQREIDLNPDIREELILGLQIKNLCKPDCKGLCITCGSNLNEGKCRCSSGAPRPEGRGSLP